jgi:hypothetical protein
MAVLTETSLLAVLSIGPVALYGVCEVFLKTSTFYEIRLYDIADFVVISPFYAVVLHELSRHYKTSDSLLFRLVHSLYLVIMEIHE